MSARYDAEHISRFFDEYGEQEWERHDQNAANRVNFHLHRHYLRECVNPGDHVLEAGAGPGRFTIELARLGAKVTVGDISPEQLSLNRARVAAAGYEESVTGREVLDILDLSRFPSGSFDAVVCFGGPLSYVFDRADDALQELLRITKPGGYALLSVMSLVGSSRRFLPGILEFYREQLDAVRQVQKTGDLYGEIADGHHCRMYRWAGLKALLERHPCEIVAVSAANFLSVGNAEALEETMKNPAAWKEFLGWEVEYCREPGALDGGTHIIAVVRRRAS